MLMQRSAIILAGGSSKRFNIDKGIWELGGKPLLAHVTDAVEGLVDEIIVVTNTQARAETYATIVSENVRFVVDVSKSEGPLIGASAGFEASEGEYSALLPFDSPLVSQEVLSLLFDCCVGKAAVIPRYTNQEIEPLHAVYHTEQALQATKQALAEKELDIQSMIERLRGVRYMSTMVIEQIDPDLKTFFNVNTPLDLKRAAVMLKPRKTSKEKRR
jgi:molybdopterin-guanine dinucleotide biosynthesis protein A